MNLIEYSLVEQERAGGIFQKEMCLRLSKSLALIALTVLGNLLVPGLATGRIEAQAARTGNPDAVTDRVELFAGYSYWRPWRADINNYYYRTINPGAVGSATLYVNRWLGVQAEGGYHPNGPNDCATTAEAGPVFRYAIGHFVPFAHVLGGGVRIGGPLLNKCTWGYGGTGGLGIDYVLHQWHERIAIRPIQADYEYNHVDYGPLLLPGGYSGGIVKMNTIRLSAGVVFRFGEKDKAQAAQMACTAVPGQVFPGEPVTVDSQILNLDMRRARTYNWMSAGGKISGRGDTISIDTNGLAAGDYVVHGSVSQGHGASSRATCDTGFTVKPYLPPSVTCSASPTSLHAGESSTITASGVSPANRPMTYTFTTTAGQITNTGNVATLSTGGVAPGDIVVTCNMADDQGRMATATAMVNVMGITIPVAPQQRSLCSLTFNRDVRRPARVDNEAKGCLDDVALALNRESGSQLVIIANHGTDEGRPTADERGMNVKEYLTAEKGIDPSRIQVRRGSSPEHTAENVLVPNGTTFLGDGTTIVDEASVVRHGGTYGSGASGTTAHVRSGHTATRHGRRKRAKTAAAAPDSTGAAAAPSTVQPPHLQ
ncbi:hypothetical protein [Terriglobus saanensis]|uniref:OmpA-like domain-containing protein n=1 Tax=Terriglobus saanensis (strain ATCC BAA-1853 / DSM 23119 / SP1PR4) TaxID=401053 RepID=E8V321_TERSS|nr:hypothetical protein [Terriglobus saanensis]ADV81296.1 hypothetical protein AciPR4_0461 [Terriglobus saanensis SP1PR4]